MIESQYPTTKYTDDVNRKHKHYKKIKDMKSNGNILIFFTFENWVLPKFKASTVSERKSFLKDEVSRYPLHLVL